MIYLFSVENLAWYKLSKNHLNQVTVYEISLTIYGTVFISNSDLPLN